MQFSLQSVLLSFVLVASALAAFGIWGIVVAAMLLTMIVCVRATRSSLGKVLVFVLSAALLALLLLPAMRAPRDSSGDAWCHNRLMNVALALLIYEDRYGTLPPACVADANGQPRHSWRVLMLPFIEQKALYDRYDLNEPWDGLKNRNLAATSTTPQLYQCPSDPAATESDMTSYLAVVGPGTAWPASEPRKLEDIPAPDRTIILVEVANSGIHWMEPRDLSAEDAVKVIRQPGANGLPGVHTRSGGYFYHDFRGFHAVMADGSVRFLPVDLAPEVFEDMLSVDKAANVDLRAINARRLNWSHIAALATLVVSFLMLLLRPKRPARSSPQ